MSTRDSNPKIECFRAHPLWTAVVAVCLATIVALTGCSSSNSAYDNEMRNARNELNTDPNSALSRVDQLLAQNPNDAEALEVRARALKNLGMTEKAMLTWSKVLDLDPDEHDVDDDILVAAHANFGQLVVELEGDLPHQSSLDGAKEIKDRARLEQAMNSLQFAIDEEDDDHASRLALANVLYRFGRLAEARGLASEVASKTKQPEAQYLALLSTESLVGTTPEIVQRFVELFDHSNANTRTLIAEHLIFLAQAGRTDSQVDSELRSAFRTLLANENLDISTRDLLEKRESRARELRTRAEARRLATIARKAESSQDWITAIDVLGRAVQLDPEIESEFDGLISRFVSNRLPNMESAFEAKKPHVAIDLWNEMAPHVKVDRLPGDVAGAYTSMGQRIDSEVASAAIASEWENAQNLLAKRDGAAALVILDQIEPKIAPSQRNRFEVDYAEALAFTGQDFESLELFDKVVNDNSVEVLRDQRAYRTYGMMLSKNGRASEAQDVLEDLPLELFNSEAFRALLVSLQDLGQWEKILARLQTLSAVPDSYRPILVNAARESALRRLRTRNATEGLAILDAYLKPKDFENDKVRSVQLQLLVAENRFDEAIDIVIDSDSNNLLTHLPSNQLAAVRQKAEIDLSGERQFRILQQIAKLDPSPDLVAEVNDLYPIYGNYLPEHESFSRVLKVDRTNLRSEDQTSADNIEWDGTMFVVKDLAGRTVETWEMKDRTWIRTVGSDRFLIPAQADEVSPQRTVQFYAEGTSWSAQVQDFGFAAEVAGTNYGGCIRVRLTDENNSANNREIVLAPGKGPIQETHLEDGDLVYTAELVALEIR